MIETPFDCLRHLVVVPVLLNGIERRFVLDSGIGLTLVREGLDGYRLVGSSFTGKRMSGQEVSVPLAAVGSVSFGGVNRTDEEVGVLDMDGFPQAFDDIDGFLSLAFFGQQPFSVDYERRTIRDGTGASGTRIPMRLEVDGPSVTAFMSLSIPGRVTADVEVDMGSDALILDERLAGPTGARLDAADARREEGVDELGNRYIRTFSRLEGSIHPAGAPDLVQHDPGVMFQRIIYDGLLGHAFLSRFSVTWDIPNSQIRLDPRSLR